MRCFLRPIILQIQVSVAFISGALGGHSNIAATKIIIHPNYNRSAVQKDNNIAIVHVNTFQAILYKSTTVHILGMVLWN